MTEKKLILIGKIVNNCRLLTGGWDLNGFFIKSASIKMAGDIIDELRKLIDEYDLEVITEHRKKQNDKD